MGAQPIRPRDTLDPALKQIIDALARADVAKHRAASKVAGGPKS